MSKGLRYILFFCLLVCVAPFALAADQNLTELTQDTSPSLTDLLYEVKDPSGTPLDRSVSHNDVLALAHDYIKVSDVKAYNVAGGTFTQDAWQTRTINTEDSDTDSICAIASNQITLAAGTYECKISCPAFRVQGHVSRLQNITDAATELLGTAEYSGSVGYYTLSRSFICGRFTIAAQKTFEIQHYCIATYATNGFGAAHNISGVNTVYTIAEFWRVRV